MSEARLIRGLGAPAGFGIRHPRALVLASQLPLTLLLAAGVAAAPAAWGLHLSSGWGQAALALHSLIFLASGLVPWHRFGPAGVPDHSGS